MSKSHKQRLFATVPKFSSVLLRNFGNNFAMPNTAGHRDLPIILITESQTSYQRVKMICARLAKVSVLTNIKLIGNRQTGKVISGFIL